MAQYDGSIRINTQINTKQAQVNLATLENRMVKTADKIASLRSKMDALKDAKIPTQEYTSAQKQVEKLEKDLENAYTRKERFLETGGNESSRAFKGMEYDIEKLETKLRQAEHDVKELVNSGKAFTLGKDTEEYAKLGQQLKYAENEMSVLEKRHDLLLLKQKKVSDKYNTLRNSAVSAFQKIGGSIKSAAIAPLKSFANSVKNTFSNIGKSANKSSGIFSKFGSRIKELALSALIFNQVSKLFSSMISGIKDGMGNLAGFSESVKSSMSSLQSSLTQLKNSLATAFAPIFTAAAPALTALINMASKAATAVGMLIAALTGQKTFTKATKVQEGYADSLGGTAKAAKEANKQLSPLDRLNNLTSDKSDGGSGGGGGAGAGAGDMFETVDIPSKISDLAKMIKDAWEKADFTEIGALIGTKLKDALENIPWDKIQDTAAKVGKSLATLINGFVEVDGLGYTIGNTIAQAINTGLIGLDKFSGNLHWDSIGKFLGEGVNGALKNIKWDIALSAAKNFGTGIAKAINSFFKETDFKTVGKSVANFVNTAIVFALSSGKELKFGQIGKKIADGINGFFRNIKAKELADAISTWVKGSLKTVSTLLKKTDFQMIGEKIGEFLSNLDLKGAMKGLGKVLWETIKGAFKLLKGLFKSAPLETSLLAAFSILKFSGLGKAVAGNISGAIKDSIGKSLANSGIGSTLTSKLTTIVGGAMVVFGEFGAVSSIFEGIAAGEESVVSGLAGITAAAGTAFGALKVLGASTPFGALITAATAVAGAIHGVWKASSELDKQLAEQEEIEKYGQTLDSLKEEVAGVTKETKDWIEQSKEASESAWIGEATMLQNLSDRYFDLYGKEHKTNEEMSEMKRIAGLLVEQMPELEGYYNQQTGLLETTKASVDALIESRLKEARTKAIEEQLVEGYKQQANQLKEVEKASKSAIDAENKMKDLHSKLKEELGRREKWQAYLDLGEQIQNATGDTTELSLKQQKIMEELKKDHGPYVDAATIEEDVRSAQEAIEQYQTKYDGIIKSFEDSKSAYEDISKTVAEFEKDITKGMTDAAKGGVDGYTNWINSRTAKKQVEDASAGLGDASVGAFKSKKGIDSHSPSKRFEEAGKNSVDGYVQGINQNKQSAIDTMTTFASGIVDTFNGMKEKFSPKGKDAVSGLEGGVGEKWRGFITDWSSKKNETVNKYKDIKSDFLKKGNDIVNGIKDGIKNLWTGFIQDWSSKKNSIINTFSNIKSSMMEIGKNIVNGIIDGIKSLWSTLTGWANDIKKMFDIKPTASKGAGVSMVGGGSPRAAAYSPAMYSVPNMPIPALATGAVIPPNREFLAVLGDQKHGTNIEAPLSTIEQAVENALKRNGGSGGVKEVTIKVPVEIDGRVLFELMKKFDLEQFNRTGRPSFQI